MTDLAFGMEDDEDDEYYVTILEGKNEQLENTVLELEKEVRRLRDLLMV